MLEETHKALGELIKEGYAIVPAEAAYYITFILDGEQVAYETINIYDDIAFQILK